MSDIVSVTIDNDDIYVTTVGTQGLQGPTGESAFDELPGTDGQVLFNDDGELGATSTAAIDITGTSSNVTGTVAIAQGGTGQITANAALNALLPSQTSNGNKYLQTNGTNSSWQTVDAGVTSVSANDSSLTISPTTGAVLAALNVANPNVWSGQQTFGATTTYLGTTSTTGTLQAVAPASGAGNNITIRAATAVSGNTNGGDIVLTPGDNSGSGVDGKVIIRQPGGTPDTHELQISHNTNAIFRAKTGTYRFHYSDTVFWELSNGSIVLNGNASDLSITGGGSGGIAVVLVRGNDNRWRLGTSTGLIHGPSGGVYDIGLNRGGTNTWLVTDGSTGIGKILTATLVEANTAGSGSPNILTATEARTTLTNEGSTAQNYHTLPTAVAGLDFEFICQDTDGIRIVANTGDTIRDVATVSASAGFIQSTTVGSVIRLKAINAVEWFVVYSKGTWTIDS